MIEAVAAEQRAFQDASSKVDKLYNMFRHFDNHEIKYN